MLAGLYYNFNVRLVFLLLMTIVITWLGLIGEWMFFIPAFAVWSISVYYWLRWDSKYARKVAFMFDAIDNNDYMLCYATRGRSSNDKMVSESLNRITQIILEAKKEAIQREKYYELILNSVNTGIIVLDDQGVVFQTNNEALRLLGLNVLTNIKQLARIDSKLVSDFSSIQAGNKQQLTFQNERGSVNLSVRVSEMTLQEKHVRILAINDINNELDQKEIDSWIRLTRVLTHEIMNSVTPITSLSDTLLKIDRQASPEIQDGLQTISKTGKGLIAFVESYRRFTHIPTPKSELFYVRPFVERIYQLVMHQIPHHSIRTKIVIEPEELILHADENLIAQVLINLIKNAVQAIGTNRQDRSEERRVGKEC